MKFLPAFKHQNMCKCAKFQSISSKNKNFINENCFLGMAIYAGFRIVFKVLRFKVKTMVFPIRDIQDSVGLLLNGCSESHLRVS